MKQFTDTPIRTRRDGSIDTAFYMARGRRMRSEAAHEITRRATPEATPRRGLFSLFAF